ncbi:MAG: hypothetical protein H7Z40_19340 [Phycisphaerae bacterium]|nr:hypothetical protein [Gemmatimonadaceae bacterium]
MILASVLAGGGDTHVLQAQTITPRTVPVQMGQQYDIIPSDRAGMGNVRIAIDDATLDPFVNPAKATRLKVGFVAVAPYFVNQSDARGGGRTFPLSGIATVGKWAVGGQFAMQQLDRTRLTWNAPTSEQTASNQYVTGILARSLGKGFAVGAAAYFASLEAQQGIDQLYSGSDRILQDGSARDFRVGMTREWGTGHNFEAMVLRSRFDMTHDVRFPAFERWSPPNIRTPVPERNEHNRDHTTAWGAHSEYSRPVGSQGWKFGLLGTVNRLSHPKIPDYVINQVITVPRDPGHTWAYNAGVGMSRTVGKAIFGFDVIVEPMRSTTWAEAARDTVSRSGVSIPKGGHTVDNKMRFSNSQMRVGFERMAPPSDSGTHFGFQLGLGVNSIRYRLWQTDQVRDTSRVQNENWMEWTPTAGLKLRSKGYEIRYALSMTCGAGGDCSPPMPGCGFGGCGDDVSVVFAPGSGGVIAAPTDVLRFNGGRVITQRITISLLLR